MTIVCVYIIEIDIDIYVYTWLLGFTQFYYVVIYIDITLGL